MRGLALAVALLALACAGGPHALAAQAAGAPARLTLEQALALAEAHNPGYRQITNNLDLNGVERRDALLSVLPRPSVSLLQTGMNWNLQRVGTDPFGNPLPNPEARMVQSSTSNQRIALGLNVSFANLIGFRNREANAAPREIAAANQLQTLRADVRRSFLAVQQQQFLLDLELELLESERRNQQAAEQLFALARRERVDLLEAELNVAAQEEAIRQAEATLVASRHALRNTIGDGSLAIAGVEPVPYRLVDAARLDEEALVRAALDWSPQIVQQRAQIEAGERQGSLLRGQQWLPTLRLDANTGRSELERGGGGAFLQPNPSGGWDRTISLSLMFPDLGRHFETQNQLQRQQIQLRNAEEELRRIRLNVEQSVRTALVGLRSDLGSLELQERRAALAEERLQLRLESYRLGQGTFQDLHNASTQAAQIRRSLLGSRYNVELRLVALEQTLGMPLERLLELGTR